LYSAVALSPQAFWSSLKKKEARKKEKKRPSTEFVPGVVIFKKFQYFFFKQVVYN